MKIVLVFVCYHAVYTHAVSVLGLFDRLETSLFTWSSEALMKNMPSHLR